LQRLLIIVLVVFVVLAFMTTYTVKFTETAVVTTFGNAGQDSVITEPGLRFKIPYVQTVTKYDRRAKFLENRMETQQTADQRQVVVTTYMTWRVADPLKFFQKFGGSGDREADHYKAAEGTLHSQLRAAMSALSRYRLDELLGTKESKLARLEKDMMDTLMRTDGGNGTAALSDYGIEPVTVAISAISFPQATSKAVFERMIASRTTVANEAIAQGSSRAETIRKRAEADAQRITAFAERLAGDIRSKGVAEAAQYTRQMASQPQLAVFLKQMEFLREAYAKQATLVFSTGMPGLDIFRPDFITRLGNGKSVPLDVESLGAAEPASTPGGDK
jgi:modulator of FtsH protease HflC